MYSFLTCTHSLSYKLYLFNCKLSFKSIMFSLVRNDSWLSYKRTSKWLEWAQEITSCLAILIPGHHLASPLSAHRPIISIPPSLGCGFLRKRPPCFWTTSSLLSPYSLMPYSSSSHYRVKYMGGNTQVYF